MPGRIIGSIAKCLSGHDSLRPSTGFAPDALNDVLELVAAKMQAQRLQVARDRLIVRSLELVISGVGPARGVSPAGPR